MNNNLVPPRQGRADENSAEFSSGGLNPRISTIADFLVMSTKALIDVKIESARLDSELILSHALGLPREWILAHDDATIEPAVWKKLCFMVAKRAQRQPLAYVLGTKEFYGRNFIVTPDVLIPRPESEVMIDEIDNIIGRLNSQSITAVQQGLISPDARAKWRQPAEPCKQPDGLASVLDLGTGSGCLAITAKLEHPELNVTAVDISPAALEIAELNALRLHADITFKQSDLFSSLSNQKFDVILANLPYVDIDWPDLSPELIYEPQTALFANDKGLELIKKTLAEAQLHLNANGYLILEMDRRQIPIITQLAQTQGYKIIRRQPFTLTLQLAN